MGKYMQDFSDHELVSKVLASGKDQEVVEHGQVFERDIKKTVKIDPEQFEYVWANWLKKLIRTKVGAGSGFRDLMNDKIPPANEVEQMENFLKTKGIL